MQHIFKDGGCDGGVNGDAAAVDRVMARHGTARHGTARHGTARTRPPVSLEQGLTA